MVESNWKVLVKNEFQTVYPFCVRAFFSNVWYTNNLRQRISFVSHKKSVLGKQKTDGRTESRSAQQRWVPASKAIESVCVYRHCGNTPVTKKGIPENVIYSEKIDVFLTRRIYSGEKVYQMWKGSSKMIQFITFSGQGWSCAQQQLPQRKARQPFHWTKMVVKRNRMLRLPLTTSVHKISCIFKILSKKMNSSTFRSFENINVRLKIEWRLHSQNSLQLRCKTLFVPS